MDQQAAHKLLAEAETIHSAEAVQAALDAVAARIRARLADKNPLVLCVLAGGVVFCGQLLPKLDFPCSPGARRSPPLASRREAGILISPAGEGPTAPSGVATRV